MESREEVREYLKSRKEFSIIEITGHFTGINNHNFVFKSGEGKFVLRTNRDEMESENLFRQERKILEFLEGDGVEFTPGSILYDEEKEAHIVEYLPGEDVSVGQLEGEMLEKWVEKLVKLHSLEFKDYRAFCEEKGYSYDQPSSIDDKIDRFGRRRIEKARKNTVDEELLEWVEEKIETVETSGEDKPGLSHGDIANSCRKEGEKLYIIDWEFAGFSKRPESALSYVYIHGNLGEGKYSKIKDIYRRKIDYEGDLEKALRESERNTRIFDVIWSLMKASQLESRSNSEWRKYLEQARERRKKYRERFGD